MVKRRSSGRRSREPIVVIGGGGHARVVISILRKLDRYDIVGYTDLEDKGEILGIPFIGRDTELGVPEKKKLLRNAVIAVGQVGVGDTRFHIWQRLQSKNLSFPLIVSPDAILNDGVAGGEGTVIMDGAVVNTGASLGRGVIVNTNSTVEHDVMLEDWVHVAPGATISGGAMIGRCSMVGAGATVIEGKHVAAGCMVGAGATVINDLVEAGVYVGTPARRVK